MDTNNSITLLVALITAAIALIGYWSTQHLQRRDQRSRLYADAMAAISRYEQTPHLVCRRKDSSASTRSEINAEISACTADVSLNDALLNLDSPIVSKAYRLIMEQTSPAVRKYRSDAWRVPPIERDEDVPGTSIGVKYENWAARDLCLKIMRSELAVGSFFRRRAMRREINKFVQAKKEIMQQNLYLTFITGAGSARL